MNPFPANKKDDLAEDAMESTPKKASPFPPKKSAGGSNLQAILAKRLSKK